MPEYASLSHHPGSGYIVASVEAIPGIGAWGAASGVTALKARVSNNTAGVRAQIGYRRLAAGTALSKRKFIAAAWPRDLLDREEHSHERPNTTVHV